MIVQIRVPSGDKTVQGYLSLSHTVDGDWQPITGQPTSSANTAIEQCIADACESLQELRDHVSEQLQTFETSIARLLQNATRTDRLRIFGEVCEIDDEGTVLLTSRAAEHGPPWPAIDIEIDEPTYQALWLAMGMRLLNRSHGVKTIVSAVLNEPLEVLVAVRDKQPDMLPQVAALMVEIRKRQAARWNRRSTTTEGEDSP